MPRYIQPWTQDKFRLLELYLPRYLRAEAAEGERVYIDGFAGPGRNELIGSGEVVPSTPLLAMDAAATDAPEVAFTRLFFIESSEATASELRSVIAERGGDDRVEVIVGDVNVELPRVLEGVERTTPTFVNLNAEVIEPNWATIEQIAAWNIELLVSFPLTTAINRSRDSSEIKQYFGEPGWSEDWGRGDYEAVREFYKGRLADLGFTRQQDDDLLVQRLDPVGHKDYWLIHAARREAEPGVWQWVLRQGPFGA